MRLGVAPSGRRSAADAVRLARLAEEAGLDEVWVSEDYLERGAFAVAGAVAAATERVRVGLGVVNPWTRHVALTAMESLALAEISQGRAVVGLGASNAAWMQGRLGIPFERPVHVLARYTDVLRRLLRGEHVREEVLGHALDCRLEGVPAQPVPLVWGVKGPRAFAASGQHADGVMLSVLSSPAYVAWVTAEHRPAQSTAYASFAVADDRATAREQLRAHTARFLGMHGVSEITARAGVDPALGGALRERLLAGRSGADLVDDATVGAVTVSGTPDDAAEAVLAHRDAGLDSLVVIDDGTADPDVLVSSLVDVASRAGLR